MDWLSTKKHGPAHPPAFHLPGIKGISIEIGVYDDLEAAGQNPVSHVALVL
jgi:hypothetical protein